LLEDRPGDRGDKPDDDKLPEFLAPGARMQETRMRGVKISPIGFVFGIGALLVLGIAGYLTFGPKPAPPPEPVLTVEARQYLPNLELGGVHMQAAESYSNQRVIEILGDISNHGSRTVKRALVTCRFFDWGGHEVARESDYIVGGTAGPLSPGGTKPFRLAFDTIPETWTQALPQLVIREIQFQ
jgi:hypothetical protein